MSLPLKFDDVRDSIINAIQDKAQKINIPEEVILVNGFVFTPYMEIMDEIPPVNQPCIPAVCLIGSDSGKLYFLSLGSLIGDVWTPKETVEPVSQ